MNGALRDIATGSALYRQIGKVGGEQHIVLAERGAEQRGLPAADRQPEFGEHPCVVAEETVTGAAYVAIGIGNDKAVALLERKQPVRLARSGRVQRCKGYGRIELALVELGHSSNIPVVLFPSLERVAVHDAFACVGTPIRRA